jgi:hypothetical protein
LQVHKNESTRKAKGLALVIETSQSFDQFRLPETRVTMRIKAAQLLWPSDEKKASALMAQAIETVKQMVGNEDEPRRLTLPEGNGSTSTNRDRAGAHDQKQRSFLQSSDYNTERRSEAT